MAEHASRDNPGADLVSANGEIDSSESRSPNGKHEQAVRPGITGEVERRHLGVAGRDAHLFPAEKKKDRPETVCKLGSEKQRAEGSLRCDALGGKGQTLMSEEHAR